MEYTNIINGICSFFLRNQHHPLLQFLPQKLAEWLAKNMSEELNLPDPGDEWSSEALNNILIHCLVSNRRGNNLHTFQCVEFESDLYRGVMRARCYPFNMEEHRFYGKNVKVLQHSIYIHSIHHNIPHLWNNYTWYISILISEYTIYILLIIMVYFDINFVIYYICF